MSGEPAPADPGIPAGWKIHHPPAEAGRRDPRGDGGETQADRLTALAMQKYRLGRTHRDEPFALPHDGPRVVKMLRGGRDSIRALLAFEYNELYGRTPSSTALADMCNVLEGKALQAEPEDVWLRVAPFEGGIVLDLGTQEGACVVVRPDGWRVEPVSPVLFRRTSLNGALPRPERGNGLQSFRSLLNTTDEAWPLILGWLVSALLPDLAHPVLLFTGEQGAGKSTAARMISRIIDPGPGRLLPPPRDPEQWGVTASSSWVVSVDNVSGVSEWWSDALCRAVTGDSLVRRKLYSDDSLSVIEFRRPVMLTGIELAALRGDLGDRLLMIDLERIDRTRRQSEQALWRSFDATLPAILADVLDLLVLTLTELPRVTLESMPRLADFARVLAAMDRARGTDSLATYTGQADRISEDVLDSSAVALRLIEWPNTDLVWPWEGTISELAGQIQPSQPPKTWPKSPKAMGNELKRLAPALAEKGIYLEQYRANDPSRKRLWRVCVGDRIEPIEAAPEAESPPTGDREEGEL